MAIEIQVLSVLANGINGHYAVSLRVIENTEDGEKVGPVEVHGIDGIALSRKYGDISLDSAIDQWLASVKAIMLDHYNTHAKVSEGLGKLVGKRLPVG